MQEQVCRSSEVAVSQCYRVSDWMIWLTLTIPGSPNLHDDWWLMKIMKCNDETDDESCCKMEGEMLSSFYLWLKVAYLFFRRGNTRLSRRVRAYLYSLTGSLTIFLKVLSRLSRFEREKNSRGRNFWERSKMLTLFLFHALVLF